MKEVEYLDKIPEFDCCKMETWMQGAEFHNYLERLSHVKGKAWSYENEVRMFIPRRIPEHMKRIPGKYLDERELNDVRQYFVRIDSNAIRRVDFGPRADSVQVSRLIAELKTRVNTGHITFWQAELKPGYYTYDYSRVG